MGNEYGFEWDDDKAAENLRKHGVSFEEASTACADPRRIEAFDEEHSEKENWYLAIGRSKQGQLLIVSHTPRGTSIRIISARIAEKTVEQFYEENN